MADQGYRPPPKAKTIWSHPKTKISAPCPTAAGKGKWSTLGWDVMDNNPRIVVYTNCPEDQGEQNEYGKINANMDTWMFFNLMQVIGIVADAPAPTGEESYRIPVGNKKKGWDRQANKPGEAFEVSTTFVGKDKDGTMWISVKSKKAGRPVIKFPFKMPEFHDLRNADGTPWDEGAKSVLAARGYVTMMTEMMGHYLPANYTEPKPKDDNGGGNRGGYNRGGNGGGNGGGGYNGGGNNGGGQSNGGGNSGGGSGMDDDIPF